MKNIYSLPLLSHIASFFISCTIFFIFGAHYPLHTAEIGNADLLNQGLVGVFGLALSGMAVRLLQQEKYTQVPLLCAGAIALLTLANLIFGSVNIKQYGDAIFIQWFTTSGQVFSRWLAGTALLIKLYPMFNASFVKKLFQHWPEAYAFIALTGVATMLIFTGALARLAEGKWVLLLPMLTPIWLIFYMGYQEYYPFIAGAWLCAIFLCFSDRAFGWIWWALAAGILSLLYVGFWPAALLLCFGAGRSKLLDALKTSALALIIFLIGIKLFWPQAQGDFIASLISDLNLGEKNTGYLAYKGQSMSDNSIFFKPSYAFTYDHLFHLLYMLSAGLGATILVAFGAILSGFSRLELAGYLQEKWLGCLLVGWQLFYFFMMIPKFGPVKDFDLFFSFYLTAAALLGSLIDYLFRLHYERFQKIIPLVITAMIGNFAGTTAMLMIT